MTVIETSGFEGLLGERVLLSRVWDEGTIAKRRSRTSKAAGRPLPTDFAGWMAGRPVCTVGHAVRHARTHLSFGKWRLRGAGLRR